MPVPLRDSLIDKEVVGEERSGRGVREVREKERVGGLAGAQFLFTCDTYAFYF